LHSGPCDGDGDGDGGGGDHDLDAMSDPLRWTGSRNEPVVKEKATHAAISV
jgi:hypothetical protein